MDAHIGYLGAGKTYHLTKFLKEKHDQGNFIITNYETTFSDLYLNNFEKFVACLENLYIMARKKKKPILGNNKIVYIGLDEASVFFNARSFKHFPRVLLDFIPQMRKIGVEMHYTVQSPFTIDVNFRRLTEFWHVYKKVIKYINLGYTNIYLLNPENPDINSTGSGNEKFTSVPSIFRFSGEVFKLYNTYQILKAGDWDPDYNEERTKEIVLGIDKSKARVLYLKQNTLRIKMSRLLKSFFHKKKPALLSLQDESLASSETALLSA